MNVGDSPLFVVVYGDSGLGKSVDQMLCAPRSWLVCKPGAEKPAFQFGFTMPAIHANGILELQEILAKIIAAPPEKRPPSLIVDDLTLLMQHTFDALRPQYPPAHTFAFWERIKRESRKVADMAREAHIDLFASMHRGSPSVDQNDVFHRGGPEMPARSMRTIVPHIADVVYRAEIDAERKPWPLVYSAEVDTDWLVKDRTGVVRGIAPGNLREIFRCYGRTFPRLPGMEWQDAVAEQVSNKIQPGESIPDVWNRAEAQLIAKGLPEPAIYWALRDGVDRATLAKRQRLLGFFNSSSGANGAVEVI